MARPELETSLGLTQPDDLDALFEIDTGMDDIFESIRRGTDTDGNNTRLPNADTRGTSRAAEALGIDEEVKIVKKRQPVAKLDEARLLSDAGVSKLQKISKKGFKLRGKGHEFSDVAQILRTYQLWLDDLYPRAKFADGLTMIEKLGHSKRMQIMRKAWIDEGKPRASAEVDDFELEHLPATINPGSEAAAKNIMHETTSPVAASPRPITEEEAENDNSSEDSTNRMRPSDSSFTRNLRGAPDEDELDALLAEEPSPRPGNSFEITPSLDSHRPQLPVEESFEDDEEAMREMRGSGDDMW